MKPLGRIGGDRPDPARVAEVRRWAREAFGLDDDATVLVAELACTEPGCPPIETLIAVLRADGRTEHRLHRRVGEITQIEIRELAAGPLRDLP